MKGNDWGKYPGKEGEREGTSCSVPFLSFALAKNCLLFDNLLVAIACLFQQEKW